MPTRLIHTLPITSLALFDGLDEFAIFYQSQRHGGSVALIVHASMRSIWSSPLQATTTGGSELGGSTRDAQSRFGSSLKH